MIPLSVSEISALDGFLTQQDVQELGIPVVGFATYTYKSYKYKINQLRIVFGLQKSADYEYKYH